MEVHLTNSMINAGPQPASKYLGRLRWLTIVLAIAFLICVQGVAMGIVMPLFGIAYGHVLSMTAYSAGVIIFAISLFRVIDRMQARIVQKNEELEAVNTVSRAVAGSLDSERTMGLALENVMATTGSLAGEITIHGRDSLEPRRFALGDPELIARLCEAGETAGSNPVADQRHASVVEIPLMGLGEEVGTMRLVSDETGPLTGGLSAGFLEGVGAQVAMAVTAGELHEDVLRRQVNSQALYEIAIDITSAQDPKDVLWSITERARELLNAEAARLCLYDDAASKLSVVARSGHEAGAASPPPASHAIPGQLGELDVVPLVAGGLTASCPMRDRASRQCAPLNAEGECIGELCISGPGIEVLDDEDRHLLAGIAELGAIAVQKSRLLERSHQLAVLEEREWLAREMHDSLAQVLGYLHLKSQAALGKLSTNALPQVEDELREMAELAKEGYADVREAILGLRETVSPSTALVDVLQGYVQKFSRRAGVETDLRVNGDHAVQLSPGAQAQVIRVVQEALTNVRKHAGATRAEVCLDQTDRLTITIEDNGNGFEPARLVDGADRFGLWTMRERAERVGGKVEIDSAPGRGTTVRVEIPAHEE